ncbi:MAG TPA: hypothetical protein VH684_11425 [Xanthobacteraceae bacterium]
MISRLPNRLGAILALVGTVAVFGCGRKAGLDPPPVASISQPVEGAPVQADASQSGSPAAQPKAEPMFGPDGKPIAPKTGEKKWTPLDWLLN